MNEIKAKFQEKYKKDLVAEIKDETSGDYEKIALALLDAKRASNSSPDLESCQNIAKEIHEALGQMKIFLLNILLLYPQKNYYLYVKNIIKLIKKIC